MTGTLLRRCLLPLLAPLALLASPAQGQMGSPDTLRLPGLERPVEVIRDRWGVNHIYAQTEPDLFFAQGYAAARDRLFQFEIWRRQATGTVAEILGPRELRRDIGTRLFQFRGDLEKELNHYHPRGAEIIRSYVRGVNAYIAQTERSPELLPVEFALLGIRPQPWTPEVVVSRHQGLLGNLEEELDYARAVVRVGPEAVKAIEVFEPGPDPDLELDPAIQGELLFQDILGIYEAFRRPIRFRPEDVVAAHRGEPESFRRLASASEQMGDRLGSRDRWDIGSNNWVVSGRLTESGMPIMANDPHRAHSAPSLRYWVHLVGPGWNVIGGGEPEIPGVSIGHNEQGAWGLTVFATDGEDLYVYDTDPADPNRYRYRGGWEGMRVIGDTVRVEGEAPVAVELKYTRHGPVVHEDRENGKAYAVRAAWMEIGGAPYLASLRMDQAQSWEEFRDASAYSHIPGENMLWADRAGNIGWQAVGIAPIRPNWSGLVPVPGDGRYEWAGYLPILQKPHELNPARGFIATANNNLIPDGYPHREAVGWEWSDPYRWQRISEVLGSGRKLTLADMAALQTDELSIPARTLVPLLEPIRAGDPHVEQARQRLLAWDYVLGKGSVPAAIYNAWERQLRDRAAQRFIPAEARDQLRSVSMRRLLQWLTAPDRRFGPDPAAGRDAFLAEALGAAVEGLREQLGDDQDGWEYGRIKQALIRHPLSPAVGPELRAKLDVGPAPRGGNSYTVNQTGSGDNQTSGASFRIIAPTADWDATLGANTPGQGGDPDGPHYRDLFQLWAADRYFPAVYSRDRVEDAAESVLLLVPGR